MAGNQKVGLIIGGAVAIVLAILLLIILPMSFSFLDYYEYGFARRRTTGNVDTSYVYEGGRHLLGPDFQFKKFYAAAQFVSYPHIPIFTLDNLEVSITVELQYFLVKEDLKLLHDSFDVFYHSIIENNAKDALKNAVTKFDTDEFITNRSVIQADLYDGVRRRLNGLCCIPGCKKDCPSCKRWEVCDKGCIPRERCTKDDKGLFIEVRYLELHDIDIPYQVNERKLLSLIRDLEKEKEISVKEETIVRKQTELQVAKIKNEAKEILALANANYNLLLNAAEVNYSKIIENEHNDGLKKLFSGLGFSDKRHKAAINYLRALNDNEKVKYSIDFNTLVATSNNK